MRGPCNFRERDVRAAVKAVTEAGAEVSRVEFDTKTGKVVIITGKPDGTPSPDAGGNIVL